jgi:hypothetical protein
VVVVLPTREARSERRRHRDKTGVMRNSVTIWKSGRAHEVSILIVGGVADDFMRVVDVESDLQLAALLPEQRVLMAFDLVSSSNQHAFTGANHFDHWMIVLKSLRALQGYDTITIGHDTPVDRSAIDSTMTYVKRAKAIHSVSADAKTYRT